MHLLIVFIIQKQSLCGTYELILEDNIKITTSHRHVFARKRHRKYSKYGLRNADCSEVE